MMETVRQGDFAGFDLLLDADARCLRGIEMSPLLTGELKLLAFLGSRPLVWHSVRVLSRGVFQRDDAGAKQLVWKYVSTLRQKLSDTLPSVLQSCRRRGYRCSAPIALVSMHAAVVVQDILSCA
jgi:DNA-binding response OmpR family regulator